MGVKNNRQKDIDTLYLSQEGEIGTCLNGSKIYSKTYLMYTKAS